jgi:hypothetical protein
MKKINPSVNQSLTVDGLARVFRSFPDSSFLGSFQNKSIMDALFCGHFQEMMNNENNKFGITFNPNSALVKIKRQLMDFIASTLPSHTSNGKTVCGNITVHELGHCANNLLNFKQAKFMVQGYILVSPDTPLVRSLVDSLNKPLRYANLLHDLAVDMNRVSMDMQDEIGQSLLNPFMTVSYKYSNLFYWAI